MNNAKRLLALLLAAVMVFTLAACGKKAEEEQPAEENNGEFNYSSIYDENGYFKGIKALDYVKLADHSSISVSSESIASQEEYFRSQFPKHVTDRAVADGDKVNIDYVGSVDGVEFDGGNTGGAGTDVTIGVTNYIDDFLQQLIGHMPGETFDVNVTFPEDYGKDELNGKDAVFVTTINHIVEEAVLDDGFVSENLSGQYGWTTVEEMHAGIAAALASQNLYESSEVSDDVPEAVLNYELDNIVDYYKQYAEMYSVSFEEFLANYMGIDSEAALREQAKDYCLEETKYYLFMQAVAEANNIVPSDADAMAYIAKQYGDESYYDTYVESFGANYLKSLALYTKVDEFIAGRAVVE